MVLGIVWLGHPWASEWWEQCHLLMLPWCPLAMGVYIWNLGTMNSYINSCNTYAFIYQKIIWIHSLYDSMYEFMCMNSYAWIHMHMNIWIHLNSYVWIHIHMIQIWIIYKFKYEMNIWIHSLYDFIYIRNILIHEYMRSLSSFKWIQMYRFWIHL